MRECVKEKKVVVKHVNNELMIVHPLCHQRILAQMGLGSMVWQLIILLWQNSYSI